MTKIIFRWIKITVLFYCIIGTALYYLQNTFLFHPVKLSRDYAYEFNMPFAEVEIPVNKTDTLNMVKFFPKGALRKGVVIYFHGNKGNINRYAKFATAFTANGYEVWMEDYPGFGKSTGKRSEQILYEQAKQVYTMAVSGFGKDSIIVYGKSFGTGLAAYIASLQSCKQLILETPYYSVPALFGCYAPVYPVSRMSIYKIPTNEYLQEVNAPVTIFHGTDDGVIPYRCAARLKAVIKSSDQFITIKNGSHHNLASYPQYQQVLDSLLKL